MTVRLVSYSQTPDGLSITDQIAKMARVSNIENENNTVTSERLIKYLIKHGHWSPFEMVSVCMEIYTTRDIARQILRHRSFSFQEFSQRYAKVVASQTREARFQDLKNRQNSNESDNPELNSWWEIAQQEVIGLAHHIYAEALERGIAKEQARAILPEGNTVSRLYMNGTLRSWIHYIHLRTGPDTQKEHREIAVKCAKELLNIFPYID